MIKMLNLKGLCQPEEFWEYFEQIANIPRCSQREERIRNFIRSEGIKFGFKTQVDKIGNLAIYIPAKSTKKENLILQCHMDMVCEKNDDVVHDFSKDPLKLKVIDIGEEKWLTAEGTTLGADDGNGICFNLSIMKKVHDGTLDFDSLSLTLLFTVLEEFNLGGAKNIDKKLVDGTMLINLDSGGEGMITNGCTGGIGFITDINTKPISVDTLDEQFNPLKLSIGGLIGGHSGGDINRGRANANKLLCHILWKLHKNYTIYISAINGGNAANAITREAYAIINAKEGDFEEIKSFIRTLFTEIKKNYEDLEINMQISLEKIKNSSFNTIFSYDIQERLLDLLYIIPSGPLILHPKISSYAFASTNIGILKTEEEHLRIRMLHRSFNKFYNKNTCEQIITLLEMSGLEMVRTITGSYPPWEPKFDSKLLNLAKSAHKELFEEDPIVILIQGGLESTLLINLNPQMEAIAMGPTTVDVHSPNERLRVQSVEHTWKFLLNILKKLDSNS